MLDTYFVRPQTVDRIRASWIGPEIECYVVWLAEHGYAARSVLRRVPLLVEFGEFGRARGARAVGICGSGRVGERRPVSRGVADCHLVSSRPPSIRACGSPAHGSPTFFTVSIQ
jgi:hypothetical protein